MPPPAAFSPFLAARSAQIVIVRGADTLAVGHGRQRRVGEAGVAGTLVRRYQPKSVFLWGSTPFLWARPKKWGGTAGLSTNTQQRIGEFRRDHMPGCGRQGPSAKGETPGEGSPFDPLLRFFEHGAFRALRRGPGAPPLDPARFFVKKRGKKLLRLVRRAQKRPGGSSAGPGAVYCSYTF